MEQIRRAEKKDIPALQQMWAVSFGDSPVYTDYVFAHLLRPEQIVVCTEADSPAAMLCLQPFSLAGGGQEALPGAYIFGVATLPEHRGKGLSTRLLEETHRQLSDEGAALSVLVPADDGLFGFYGKRGYTTAFWLNKAELPGESIPRDEACMVEPLSGGVDLTAIRDRVFGDSPYVRWDRQYLSYIAGECGAFGGQVLALNWQGERGYAVCYPEGETVAVKELAISREMLWPALSALHRHFDAKLYRLYLRADFETSADKVLPFAMIRWYDKKNQKVELGKRGGYIAHVLD